MHESTSSSVIDRRAAWWVLKDHRSRLIVVSMTAFLGGLFEAVFLVSVTRTGFALTEGDDQVGLFGEHVLMVNQTLALALVLLLARFGLAAITAGHAAALTANVMGVQRRRLASAFLDASWEAQQGAKLGSLQELLTTYSGQAASLASNASILLVSLANLVAMLGIALRVDPIGAIVLVVAVGILGIALRPIRSIVRQRSGVSAETSMTFATRINETSHLGLELHVFHVQDAARDGFNAAIDEGCEAGRREYVVHGLVSPIYTGLAYVALLAALAVVGLSDVTSITALGTVMLVMLRSLSYGQALQSSYSRMVGGVPFVEDLRERLAYFESHRRRDGGESVGSVGSIAVENVYFSYVPGQDVLQDVSFEIDRREIIGIVGPSGGGKSTLVQLLLGLRDPSGGRVTVDGRDIRNLSKAEWARKVTFVPQGAHLITGTVADNIRFLRPGVSDAAVERAARLASLHDDIAGFPEGYDRQVGEQGGHLSGGQQQRLCIARALVETPDVLILDEPTSALDVRSEHLIRATLLELRADMTVIVIAHRLSTLGICDRIMVIQEGKLRGFDTPKCLEESSEFYREALLLSGMR